MTSSQDPRPGDSAVEGPIDPELPTATYTLEPDVVEPLLRRVATSHGAGAHRPIAPFTGSPLAAVPLSSATDVADCVGRARVAQRAWATTSVRERTQVLSRLGALVTEHQSDVLDLIQLESGKARLSAFEEIADVAQLTRHYAVRGPRYLAARRVPGMFPLLTDTRVHLRPLGVIGVIGAWNYPLTLAVAEAVPALLAGNAVVLKPDPQTTLTALWVAEQFEAAGLPDGLFSVVAGGADVGTALTGHVDHIAFTGSTPTGRKVAAQAGERLIGATLELGGKNPLYVAADADLRVAAAGAVRACFSNTGQLCVSIERLLLHEDIADEFLALFVPRVRDLRLGAGLDYTADIGSLANADQLHRVVEHVDDAIAHGARALTGGVHRSDVGPLFYAPTVLDAVPDDALCARAETFGPVVSVRRVRDDDEAVRAMNDTEFGLNASIWTRSLARGRHLAAQVEAGTVNVNEGYTAAWGSVAAPMGGFKDSGLGRRHGREIVEELTQPQTVAAERFTSLGLTMDTLYGLGGERAAKLLTGALGAMRRLRLP